MSRVTFQNESLIVFQSALFQTTSSVIVGDESVVVVDPTWLPDEVAEIAAFVDGMRQGRELFLLFTHSDFDHILGWGAFPGAKTIASQRFVDNPHRDRCVQDALAWDSEYYLQRPYDVRYPPIDVAVSQDGQELMLGEMRLTFTLAPGHTPDGLITVIEPHGVLIAGDYLSDIEFPFLTDSRAYENTLRKLDAVLKHQDIQILIPGHGRITTDKQQMQDRCRQSSDYIRTLRHQIASGNQPAIDEMLRDYLFSLGMKASHQANQELLRTEAGERTP